MAVFVLRRLAILLLMLVLVSLIVFLLPFMTEGDPARAIIRARVADQAIDPAAIAGLRVQLGLDRPLAVQYLSWLGNALQGDFGLSFTSRNSVGAAIGRALIISATLAMTALGVALAVALPLGTIAALRAGRAVDAGITFFTQSLVALPEYFLAPIGILLFALKLAWLPSSGWQAHGALVLPAAVLALRPMAYFTGVVRASMIGVLSAPYITAARSRGLGMGQTLLRHGVRNGILPVATLFALWLAGLLGGSVVVEVIFAIPGMGRLIYEAVVDKDIPLLQAGLVCIVGLSVLINTAIDLLYLAVNPVMRSGHGAR
jgi:peptide/nickel transport system permease protein